jgi:transposase-like protein
MIRVMERQIMRNKPYTPEFKEQVLIKVRQRGSRTLVDIAEEINISLGTLKGWLRQQPRYTELPSDGPASQWSPEQRLLALHQSHGLSGTTLHAWCREKGLFEYQLQQWSAAFCQALTPTGQATTELKALQRNHDQLQKEIRRKDKALAEAAALLVLQKKFRALWEDEEK